MIMQEDDKSCLHELLILYDGNEVRSCRQLNMRNEFVE